MVIRRRQKTLPNISNAMLGRDSSTSERLMWANRIVDRITPMVMLDNRIGFVGLCEHGSTIFQTKLVSTFSHVRARRHVRGRGSVVRR